MRRQKEVKTGPVRGKRVGLKSAVGLGLAFSMVSAAGAAGASHYFRVRGGGEGRAVVACNGGVSQLSHVLDENASIFPGDPETTIDYQSFFYQDDDGNDVFSYRIEALGVATHTGTHFDAPGHFIEGGRTVDQMDASEFIWPAYIIDVRERMEDDGPNFQLTKQDIKEYEWENGKIKKGSMVIIRTGLAEAFGTGTLDGGDGYFAEAPGFSGDAVQWLVDRRDAGGIGSDSFGPDATEDEDFNATYTILANDRVAMPGLTNLDSMNVKGDVIIASPVRLENGSGYQVNPIACHGS